MIGQVKLIFSVMRPIFRSFSSSPLRPLHFLLSLSLSFFFSLSLSIYLSLYFYLSLSQSFYLFIYLYLFPLFRYCKQSIIELMFSSFGFIKLELCFLEASYFNIKNKISRSFIYRVPLLEKIHLYSILILQKYL